jgi:undecaprenyl-diphosphatase
MDLLHTPMESELNVVVGIITSAVVGFLSIKFLLNYLKNKGFGIFAVYRIVLGLGLIIFYFYK